MKRRSLQLCFISVFALVNFCIVFLFLFGNSVRTFITTQISYTKGQVYQYENGVIGEYSVPIDAIICYENCSYVYALERIHPNLPGYYRVVKKEVEVRISDKSYADLGNLSGYIGVAISPDSILEDVVVRIK